MFHHSDWAVGQAYGSRSRGNCGRTCAQRRMAPSAILSQFVSFRLQSAPERRKKLTRRTHGRTRKKGLFGRSLSCSHSNTVQVSMVHTDPLRTEHMNEQDKSKCKTCHPMRATHLGTDDAMGSIRRKKASSNLQIERGGNKSGRCGCPACNGKRAQTHRCKQTNDQGTGQQGRYVHALRELGRMAGICSQETDCKTDFTVHFVT